MAKLEKLEEKLDKVNSLANEVARRSNNEVSILKHRITCLTILVGLLFILGACISIYSIHSFKELFYDMTIEEETVETVEQEANSENGNAININGDSNKVGD